MTTLYATATNTTGIISVEIDQDYGQPTANAVIECVSTTLSLGDSIEVDIGYVGNHAVVFRGYVLEITATRSGEKRGYSIRARDNLWRAMAMFIAAEDPLDTLEYNNIAAEDLVKAMLDLSGVSSYSLDSPGFTFAPEEPLEVQLTSAWDMISRVCWLIAWHCYDDMGTVKFLDLKPYNVGAASIHTFQTGDSGDILSVEPLLISSDKIRNRVVVYGAEGVFASASAASPFLPANFYKTEVISAPDLIDNNAMAQDIADYNLDMLNRLEKGITARVVGVPTVNARDTVTFVEAETGASGDWFVYGCKHSLSDFYSQALTLVQRQIS